MASAPGCPPRAAPEPEPAPPPAPAPPPVHDKAYLRQRYPKRRVDIAPYVQGAKGRTILGRGKHGTVRAAYSLEHGCNVAIKCQPRHQLWVAAGEMELARDLNLEYVIRVLDWARTDKKDYIVMEEAEPLKTDGATRQRARAQLEDIIAGLREIHALDIYHRDIGVYEGDKGATIKNIMVARGVRSADGVCKMTDIGKMACAPPEALRARYAFADARGLARVMHAFLKQCDPDEAEPFRRWYTAQPNLRVDDVAAHPWFTGGPRPPEPQRAKSLLFSAQVFASWVTAPAPLITGRRQPRLLQDRSAKREHRADT